MNLKQLNLRELILIVLLCGACMGWYFASRTYTAKTRAGLIKQIRNQVSKGYDYAEGLMPEEELGYFHEEVQLEIDNERQCRH